MSDISTLKEKINTKTFHFILLSLITAGLYSYIWLYNVSIAIEEVTHIKVMSTTFLIGYLAFMGMGALLVQIFQPFTPELGLVWAITVWSITVIWCFRVRKALRTYTSIEHGFKPRMNRVFSVLITFFHINYCINALPRDKQKDEDKKRLKNEAISA